MQFDWDNPATYGPALAGVDRIYLVTPVPRVSYARLVSDFLDLAEACGVRHVTYLSAYGSDQAPPQVDIRAVERELMSRHAFTSSVLRPAWVMQNFTDEHLPVVQDLITVPTGNGAEAFVDAADIAAVAAETLADPDAHAGAVYAPTGPRALTVAEVAGIIAEGLSGLADGEDFFDTLAEDAVLEYVISVPGYPRRVVGREAVAELNRGYGETIVLHGADELAVHRDRDASVVVLEYAVHDRAVRAGHAYDNHLVSVITIEDRKVTHWRDYLDPVAVFDAVGWPTHHK